MISSTQRLAGVALVMTGVICGASQQARAGGSTTTIFGGRRMGMMAVQGKPDDPAALFHNPAGLADQPGVQIYGFISPAFLSIDFRMQALDHKRFPAIDSCNAPQDCAWPIDAEGYYTREIKPEKYFGVIPYLGTATDMGWVSPKLKKLVISLAVYSPNFYGAFLPEDAPTAYHVINGLFLVISGTLGAGYRINRYISVGASVSYNYMMIELGQKISLADALTPQGQDPGGLAMVAQSLVGDLKMSFSGDDHGVGWSAGVLVNPLPWIGVGFTYSGSTNAKFGGDVSFTAYNENIETEEDLRELAGNIGYKLPRQLEIEQGLPHSFQMGVMFDIGKHVELGADARFWLYQLFKQQVIRPIYDPNEEGKEPLTEEGMTRDKEYNLSWQVNLGVMVRPFTKLMGLELMTGVGYDQSPLPDKSYTLDNPNLSHGKFTIGARWRINKHWRVSLTYLLNLYISRDIRDSETNPPTNVQVSSLSHSPAVAAGYTF